MRSAACLVVFAVSTCLAQTPRIQPVPEGLADTFRRQLGKTRKETRIFSPKPGTFVVYQPESEKCSVRLLEVPLPPAEAALPVFKPRQVERMPLAALPAPPCPKR